MTMGIPRAPVWDVQPLLATPANDWRSSRVARCRSSSTGLSSRRSGCRRVVPARLPPRRRKRARARVAGVITTCSCVALDADRLDRPARAGSVLRCEPRLLPDAPRLRVNVAVDEPPRLARRDGGRSPTHTGSRAPARSLRTSLGDVVGALGTRRSSGSPTRYCGVLLTRCIRGRGSSRARRSETYSDSAEERAGRARPAATAPSASASRSTAPPGVAGLVWYVWKSLCQKRSVLPRPSRQHELEAAPRVGPGGRDRLTTPCRPRRRRACRGRSRLARTSTSGAASRCPTPGSSRSSVGAAAAA